MDCIDHGVVKSRIWLRDFHFTSQGFLQKPKPASIDSSPPGSPIPGILQARTLEWVAVSFSTPFPRRHNSPKRKEGNERVTDRKARGLQMEEIGCKCQTFFISLSSSRGNKLQVSDGFPDSSVGKGSTWNAGDPGSIPGSGRLLGEGKGYPFQYSGLRTPWTV